jgi:pyruvate dehydrogenase E2 component (dihydrolipoamide acetyltransferase)
MLDTGVEEALKGIRKIAARRMVQAWQAPVFHLTVQVDMERLLVHSKSIEGVTVTDALIFCVGQGLQQVTNLNSHYSEEIVTTFSEINIGIAVATEKGLVVPVIHGVEGLDLKGVATERSTVVSLAREGKLAMANIEGATFTISNLGMLGVDTFDAIVNPPQVGILAIGSTKSVPVVVNEKIEIRKRANFTLTCDHRAIDGATGARFLTVVRTLIEGIGTSPCE